jgi:chromate transporter
MPADAHARPATAAADRPGLGTIAREWGWLGCVGFGGPPAHLALLRDLCVARRRWLSDREFEDAIAACNLLPGPASTQMSIFCAWRVGGIAGGLVGGLGFVVPGLIAIVALAALFLAGSPPEWVRGAGAGAGGAVAAVAVHAAVSLMPGSVARVAGAARVRWAVYLALGTAAAATIGPWLVLLLAACGLVEVTWRRARSARGGVAVHAWPALLVAAAGTGGLGALAWVALKVGALSYGGGFVIIPLMQADAVDRYGWMTDAQFLNAVALGQVTPGPVIHTVTAVGYAAAGVAGALLAAVVAFAPSFAFVLAGAPRFDRLRANPDVRAFLDGAGPAAIGAILGSSVALAAALSEPWQWAVLAGAAVLLLGLRRGVVLTLLAAGAAGVVVALAGGPVPR